MAHYFPQNSSFLKFLCSTSPMSSLSSPIFYYFLWDQSTLSRLSQLCLPLHCCHRTQLYSFQHFIWLLHWLSSHSHSCLPSQCFLRLLYALLNSCFLKWLYRLHSLLSLSSSATSQFHLLRISLLLKVLSLLKYSLLIFHSRYPFLEGSLDFMEILTGFYLAIPALIIIK
jgi:hypothetical protein